MTLSRTSLPPVFAYLDDVDALPASSIALSRREQVRYLYEELEPDHKSEFLRELCTRIGDPRRSISERTDLVDVVPVITPDRRTRRMVRRQIVDDVRGLFGFALPTGASGVDYVRRLRCLLEIGAIESPRFWRTAFHLCGSPCSLVVFTALHRIEANTALDWLATYLSPWEQARVLEKALPAIRIEASREAVQSAEAALANTRGLVHATSETGRDWRNILLSVIRGRSDVEKNRTGLLEYLRDIRSHEVFVEIERQERHLRVSVDQLFEDWAARRLELERSSTLRLLALTREFQSLRILAALASYLEYLAEGLRQRANTSEAAEQEVAAGILDVLPWFDVMIENLARASVEGAQSPGQRLFAKLLRALREIGEANLTLSDRVNRELIRHSQMKDDRARSLVSMLAGEDDITDWIEDLDRRIGGEEFQELLQSVLQMSYFRGHLRGRMTALADWCDDVYTTRDHLVPGSGWRAYPDTKMVLRTIAEVREFEELSELVEAVASVA